MRLKNTELCEVSVIYSLPPWTCGERFQREVRRILPHGHAWAGQVDWDNIKHENTFFEAFWKRFKPDEICTMPEGPWARIVINGRLHLAPRRILETGQRIERFLKRYREAKK